MIESAVLRYLSTVVAGVTYDAATSAGNAFVQYMPSDPDVAVMAIVTGGQPQLSRLPYDLPQLQVINRAGRFGFRDGDAMAHAIYDALTCLDLTTVASGTPDELYIVGCTPVQSAPTALGVDDNQRPEWSQNFNLHVPSITTNRQPVGA